MNTLVIFGAKYLFLFVGVGACWPLLALKEVKRKYFLTALSAAVIAVLLTQIAAALYFDPRPFTHGAPSLISHVADNGFPSDHTVLSITAAGLVFIYCRRLGLLLLGLALLVGVCRVLAGVHSPVDIVGGVLVGVISVVGAEMLVRKVEK